MDAMRRERSLLGSKSEKRERPTDIDKSDHSKLWKHYRHWREIEGEREDRK